MAEETQGSPKWVRKLTKMVESMTRASSDEVPRELWRKSCGKSSWSWREMDDGS